MTLHDILRSKGTTVYTIGLQATLKEVVDELVHRNVGALLVCDRDAEAGEKLAGIITERDVLHVCARATETLDLTALKVSDVMSSHLITAAPDDSLEETMGRMTEHRIRHLPVMAKGRLVGVVSIGDLVKAQHDRLALENQFMKNYISG
jgi:CBS domain-containing protein